MGLGLLPALPCGVCNAVGIQDLGRAPEPWGFLYLWAVIHTLGSRRGSWFVASPGSEGRRVAACLFETTHLHPTFYLSGGGEEGGLAFLQLQGVPGG